MKPLRPFLRAGCAAALLGFSAPSQAAPAPAPTPAAAPAAAAAAPATTPAVAAKPYEIFVGLDLVVTREDQRVPLAAIERGSFVLGDADRTRLPPTEVGSMSAARGLGLGRARIDIQQLEARRDFTPLDDPTMQAMARQTAVVTTLQEQQAQAEYKHFRAQVSLAGGAMVANARDLELTNGVRTDTFGPNMMANMAKQQEELDEFNATLDTLQSVKGNPGFSDLQSRASSMQDYDTIELSFLASATEPIADAYIVVLATVSAQGEQSKKTFYEHVGPLDATPRRIRMRQVGFKPGFQIVDTEVHLYARGHELPSNLSAKRTPLTPDETRDFLLLTHLSQNRDATLPPEPVWDLAPPALLAAPSAAPFDCRVAVNIDADGRLISIHDSAAEARAFSESIVDAASLRTRSTPATPPQSFGATLRTHDAAVEIDQSQHLPAHIVEAVRQLTFLPALDHGKPVAATTEINLASYFP